MSEPDRPRVDLAHLGLFASLYAVQGVVVAYFFTFNQVYMVESGTSEEAAATAQSVALLPFIFKFLGGPVSDRINLFGLGHRKPYIILGLVVQIAGLAGLARLDPGRALSAFTAVALATVAGLALYDTCCDGMVIDVTPPADRSRVQGTLVASRALAAMVFSLLFGYWADEPGRGPDRYHKLLWACAALSLVPLAQAFWVAEPRRAADAEAFHWAAFGALVRPRALLLLAFGALYSTIGYGVEINLGPYYRARHFRDTALGAFSSSRYVGRALGAGLLPLAWSRLPRRVILVAGILALAAATAAQAAVHGRFSAGLAGLAFGVANGWDDAIFYVLAMEASDPRMAASTYALFMAVTNISVLGGSLFAQVNARLGGSYGPAFLAMAAASLAALPLAVWLGRPARPSEREPRHDPAE